jgi:hypothetical protein
MVKDLALVGEGEFYPTAAAPIRWVSECVVVSREPAALAALAAATA